MSIFKRLTLPKLRWWSRSLKGITIGDNSIIGAGSVVTQDIDADCLAAGNPARKVKSLIP